MAAKRHRSFVMLAVLSLGYQTHAKPADNEVLSMMSVEVSTHYPIHLTNVLHGETTKILLLNGSQLQLRIFEVKCPFPHVYWFFGTNDGL